MNVILHYNDQTYQLDVPTNVPLYKLTPALAQKLDLPQQDGEGDVYLYYLLHEDEPVDPNKTLQQLPYTDREYTLAYQEVARPELEEVETATQESSEHLQITIEDINRPQRRSRRASRRTNSNRSSISFWSIIGIIVLFSCGVFTVGMVAEINQRDARRLAFVTATPASTSTQNTSNTGAFSTATPTATSTPSRSLATSTIAPRPNGNYPLEGVYQQAVYSSATNKLLTYIPNGTSLAIYDLNWTDNRTSNEFPSIANDKTYISYVAFAPDNPIQNIIVSPNNSLKVLIQQTTGYQVFTVPSESYFPVTSEEDACGYLFNDNDFCFSNNRVDTRYNPLNEDCPFIWENDTYLVSLCADIYLRGAGTSLLERTIPLGSNVLQVVEVNENKILLLGDTNLAQYEFSTRETAIIRIGGVRWPSTQAKNLFLDNNDQTFYVVHQPAGEATNWLWVGDLK